MTGHLVQTTLHAVSAASALVRMRSLGIAPHLLSEAVTLVIAQRIVRVVCPSCSEPLAATPEVREALRAGTIPFDVGFFHEETVDLVEPDHVTAVFKQDDTVTSGDPNQDYVTLINNPTVGDPTFIVAGPGKRLLFDYVLYEFGSESGNTETIYVPNPTGGPSGAAESRGP